MSQLKLPSDERDFRLPSVDVQSPSNVLIKVKDIQNQFLPEELYRTCPTSVRLYNLFESNLPCTGHLALLIATVISSMCIDEKRQVNLSTGALPTEGKTEILTKFSSLSRLLGGRPFINLLSRTTFAHYMLTQCGRYLDPNKPVGQELPEGAEKEKIGGKIVVSIEKCEDRIRKTFDLIHAGEGIFTIGDIESLMQLWNALLEEGWWEGGNRWIGHYKIGNPQSPVRHGLIIACTMADLDTQWVKQVGTMSRTVTTFYYCQEVENYYIIMGREPPKIHINYIDFSSTVYQLMAHLDPNVQTKMTFNSEVTGESTRNILELIKIGRDESTGKRAMNDRISLLKAHAKLNGREEVKIEDRTVVESLLQMCRRIQVEPSKFYFFGDRLHFQIRLRQLLGHTHQQIENDVKRTFTWWDAPNSPLYTDEITKRTFDTLAFPINKKNWK